MCLRPEKIYETDQKYLTKIKIQLGLKSRAMALKKIIQKFRELKIEGELR